MVELPGGKALSTSGNGRNAIEWHEKLAKKLDPAMATTMTATTLWENTAARALFNSCRRH